MFFQSVAYLTQTIRQMINISVYQTIISACIFVFIFNIATHSKKVSIKNLFPQAMKRHQIIYLSSNHLHQGDQRPISLKTSIKIRTIINDGCISLAVHQQTDSERKLMIIGNLTAMVSYIGNHSSHVGVPFIHNNTEVPC